MKLNWKMLMMTLVILIIEVVIALYFHDDIIRPYVGDALVIILIYCAIRTFDGNRIKGLPVYIFLFAVLIEIGQWFNLVGLLGLDDFPVAKVILGTTFDRKDVFSYAVGMIILLISEQDSERKDVIRRQKKQNRRSRRRKHPDEIIAGLTIYIKRAMAFLGILIAVFGIATYIINLHVLRSYDERIINSEEAQGMKVDCIMVLGAGVWKNNQPSTILNDRLIQGVELYKEGVSNRLLMSGDHGQVDYDEVNVMKQFAIEQGIEGDTIFMDHAGFSTYESMVRAKEIFGVEKMVIVTQEYHLYRALYIANTLGIDAYGVSADLRDYKTQGQQNIREVLARVKDYIYVKLEKEPTYLGDKIPISGSGSKTDD